jgi:hypothetical protein
VVGEISHPISHRLAWSKNLKVYLSGKVPIYGVLAVGAPGIEPGTSRV